MKKGTGDDPFANESEEEAEPNADVPREEAGDIDEQAAVAATAASAPSKEQVEEYETSTTAAQSADDLPYLARRQLKNKSVKADRDQVPFFLREEVQESERELRRVVEDELGQEVNKTDLREAAYVFAQRNPEGVAEILREWGIEYLE